MLNPAHSYFNYEELQSFLNDCANTYPDWIEVESLGKTPEGREFYFVTLTKNVQTHSHKPALWLDGNVHATELSGSQMCLHTIEYLLKNAHKKEIDELLSKFTLYIFPRISVDGSEYIIKTKDVLRSTREPFTKQNLPEQYITKDLNGDGLILQMRIEDPTGLFKICKKNPRLLVAREPDDHSDSDGPYYHILPEGEFTREDWQSNADIKNLVRHNFTQREDLRRFDLNRQSPAFFHPQEKMAGPFPLYLREAQVLAQAFEKRKNICSAICFHTFGAVLLHPPSTYPFQQLPKLDQRIYNMVGERGTQITGYPVVDSFSGFNYDIQSVSHGLWCDWYYEHRGVFAWTPELWSLMKELGIEISNPVKHFENLGEDNYLKAFDWCQKNLDLKDYYKDWEKFNHPQLGEVEIGGWIPLKIWSNPPEKFLSKLMDKFYPFIEFNLKLLPVVKLASSRLEKLNDQKAILHLRIHNEGYLPTYISEKAESIAIHPPPLLTLRDQNKKVIFMQNVDHLAGRANFEPGFSPIFSHLKMKTVRAQAQDIKINLDFQHGTEFEVKIDYQMAGCLSFSIKT